MKETLKRIARNHPRAANALFTLGFWTILGIDYVGTNGHGTVGP